MRPLVVELRRGPDVWMIRADFTGGQWHDTWIGQRRPIAEVKDDLAYIYPAYVVEEERGDFDA